MHGVLLLHFGLPTKIKCKTKTQVQKEVALITHTEAHEMKSLKIEMWLWWWWWLPLGQDHSKPPESGSQKESQAHLGLWGPLKSCLSRQETWTHIFSSLLILLQEMLPSPFEIVSCMHLLCAHLHRGCTLSLYCTPLISYQEHSQAPVSCKVIL